MDQKERNRRISEGLRLSWKRRKERVMTESRWCLILNGGTCHEYCSAIRDTVPKKRYEDIRDKMIHDFQVDDEDGIGRVNIYINTISELVKIAGACLIYDPELCATVKSEDGRAGASIAQGTSGNLEVNRKVIDERIVKAAIAARDIIDESIRSIRD